jgi:hypothetical protein
MSEERRLSDVDRQDILTLLDSWKSGETGDDDFDEVVNALSEIFNPPPLILHRLNLDTLELDSPSPSPLETEQ